MLRDVARAWGYQESEMDMAAFDPAVSMLLGACATEFEKLRQEFSGSHERILDRLAATLTPDILTVPVPAHAVLHARAIEPESVILPTHQVYYKKKIGKEEREIYFSPADAYRISNAHICYLAVPGKVFKVDAPPFRDTVIQSDLFKRKNAQPVLWLGIRVDAGLETLDGLSFFINWKNEPKLRAFLRQLPYCKWFAGENELITERGLRAVQTPEYEQPSGPAFDAEFSPAERMKNRVTEYYDEHFITVKGTRNGLKTPLEGQKRKYPEVFEQVYPLEDLLVFEDKLIWLRVEFPEYFPLEALNAIECLLNCVPVLNKCFHKEDYRLQEQLNILPLRCDNYFFDIHRVYNEQERPFHAHPLSNLRNLDSGEYTLRSRGIGKLDSRAASRHLYNLLDLLRDESAAFSAYNYDYLDSKIRQLNQEITDLEQHVREKDSQREELPFLVIKPAKGGRNTVVSVEFWSTDGEDANGIPGGARLDMYATRGFDRESIQLVLGSTGGGNRKSPSESFHEFKKALTTRDRVISREDIKTFCFARLGARLLHTEFKKGFRISDLPGEGVIRTLDVLLTVGATAVKEEQEEIKSLCYELETELNAKSAGLLPIQVKFEYNG